MTREIKFRAWQKNHKKLLPVHHIEFAPTGEIKNIIGDYGDGATPRFNGWGWGDSCWIIMQYTGRKDRNGVEIYEGDIVITKECFKQQVVWLNKYTCYTCHDIPYINEGESEFAICCTDEVIGNIYENPELLNQ